MHSKCILFAFFVVAKTYPWFIQKLSETIHDLCRENFLSHQQETFFSKWGRNSVYPLDHKTPPYQHRNHRIWRKIKPAFITFWPRTESRLCFADCRITACVRRLSSWRWLWKLKEQLSPKKLSATAVEEPSQYISFAAELLSSNVFWKFWVQQRFFFFQFSASAKFPVQSGWNDPSLSVSSIFLWNHFNQSTFQPNFFQFCPLQSILLPRGPPMLLRKIILCFIEIKQNVHFGASSDLTFGDLIG